MGGRRTVSSVVVLNILLLSSTAFAQGTAERKSAPSYGARLSAAAPATTTVSSRGTESDLQVRLSSRFVFAPGAVQSRIRVTPHPDNRLLRVTLDSPDFYRSSDIQLDGAEAALNHFQIWKSLPEGHYDVTVTVFGADGQREQQRELFDVFGSRGR